MSHPTAGQVYELIAANVQGVIRGKPQLVRLAVAGLLAEGHLLIEDVPGLGKTTLARCLARSIGGAYSRIQFTPDLLPGDITGVQVYRQGAEQFEFHPGGDLRQRRAGRRDQPRHAEDAVGAARGDGRAHGHGRLGAARGAAAVPGGRHAEPDRDGGHLPAARGAARPVPDATVGRLPEPRRRGPGDHERLRGRRPRRAGAGGRPRRCCGRPSARSAARTSTRRSCEYAARLARRDPRRTSALRYGASPRGSIALVRAAQAMAATDGRDFVTPDDIKEVAKPVLEHRLILTSEAELNQRSTQRHRRRGAGRDPGTGPAAQRGCLTDAPADRSRGWAVLVGWRCCCVRASGEWVGFPVLRALGGAAARGGGGRVAGHRPAADGWPCTREVYPDRVQRGRPAFARLRVHNAGTRRQGGFTAGDPVERRLPRGGGPRRWPPARRRSTTTSCPPTRRGRIQVGPLTLERVDPLGLGRSRLTTGDTTTLWVHPRTYPARALAAGQPAPPPRGPHRPTTRCTARWTCGTCASTCSATRCGTCTGRRPRAPGS